MNPDALQRWLSTALPRWESARVESIEEVDGGWESDVYCVRVRHGTDQGFGSERLALRRYTGDGEVVRREFAGMQHLFASGYPVPEVLAFEPSDEVLGRPFMMMRWVDGEVRSWNAADIAGLARLMSDLHRSDWRPLHSGPEAPTATDALDGWEEQLAEFATPSVQSCLGWARRSAASIGSLPAIVHLDFHTGNVLIGSDGSATVIDWTQVGVADRRFDVAWTELLLSMALGRDAATRFRTAYEQDSGVIGHMEWFEAVMAMKRLFSVLVSVRAGPEALGMRPEARDRIERDIPTLAMPWLRVREVTGIDVVEARVLFDT